MSSFEFLLNVEFFQSRSLDTRHLTFETTPSLLLVWQHAPQFRGIRLVHRRRSSERALPLRGLAAQNVLLERLAPQKLARLRPLEALRRAPMCLQLRHPALVRMKLDIRQLTVDMSVYVVGVACLAG